MIVNESVIINGKQFIKTYSDENKYIECNGVTYSEAFDPADIKREYTETNISIETDEVTESDNMNTLEDLKSLKEKANAYDILIGVSE